MAVGPQTPTSGNQISGHRPDFKNWLDPLSNTAISLCNSPHSMVTVPKAEDSPASAVHYDNPIILNSSLMNHTLWMHRYIQYAQLYTCHNTTLSQSLRLHAQTYPVQWLPDFAAEAVVRPWCCTRARCGGCMKRVEYPEEKAAAISLAALQTMTAPLNPSSSPLPNSNPAQAATGHGQAIKNRLSNDPLQPPDITPAPGRNIPEGQQ
jgi:hypothetical protein